MQQKCLKKVNKAQEMLKVNQKDISKVLEIFAAIDAEQEMSDDVLAMEINLMVSQLANTVSSSQQVQLAQAQSRHKETLKKFVTDKAELTKKVGALELEAAAFKDKVQL